MEAAGLIPIGQNDTNGLMPGRMCRRIGRAVDNSTPITFTVKKTALFAVRETTYGTFYFALLLPNGEKVIEKNTNSAFSLTYSGSAYSFNVSAGSYWCDTTILIID